MRRRNLLIGIISAGIVVGQSQQTQPRIVMDGMKGVPDQPPPAYRAKITKTEQAIVITSEDGKRSVVITRRDLIKPTIINSNWVVAPGGWIYTYTVKNDSSAKQPISSQQGLIQPGETGVVSFYSALPPGQTKIRFGAPIDVAAELKQPSFRESDTDTRFLDLVGRLSRTNVVEVDGIGPVEPAADEPEP